jgi:hypothetical protein
MGEPMAKPTMASTFVLAMLLGMTSTAPATAQNSTLGGFGVPLPDKLTRPAPSPATPAKPAEANPPKEQRTEPPQRLEGDAEAPPGGCRYRENKLELVV